MFIGQLYNVIVHHRTHFLLKKRCYFERKIAFLHLFVFVCLVALFSSMFPAMSLVGIYRKYLRWFKPGSDGREQIRFRGICLKFALFLSCIKELKMPTAEALAWHVTGSSSPCEIFEITIFCGFHFNGLGFDDPQAAVCMYVLIGLSGVYCPVVVKRWHKGCSDTRMCLWIHSKHQSIFCGTDIFILIV